MKKKFIEVEAKTTQEAIRIALEKLKVKKEDVEIKILREENKGLFGMDGAEPAKIKVIIKKKPDDCKPKS
ncbi:MAG: Jag N-terminal domain-containing protein [Candidatus Omnitrophica bacterium]|nr:Jag N-terminal domain-containing protein [Candidatus Omnitrophota bacterium]